MSWERENALSLINNGHFEVTDPGPLRAPINDFSMRRNDKLDIIMETRCPPEAKSTAPDCPSGTVRMNTDSAKLENPGGTKVTLLGVTPYRYKTTSHSRTGHSELRELAEIHRLTAAVRDSAEACYTIEWLENLPISPFVWPASIRTETETVTTRKIGLDDDGIMLFGKDLSQSSSRHAAKITIGGIPTYVCALDRKDSDGLKKPGCILYAGLPDDEFRNRARSALSFALGVYLVELGSTVYGKDWEIVSFKARGAYSIAGRVLDLPVLPPALMSMRGWQHELNPIPLARLVNAILEKYETLKFSDLGWSYWHALCAAPHIAAAHFGATIELLLRQYAATKPDRFPRKIISESVIWSSFSTEVDAVVSKLEIPESQKDALRRNIGGLNRVHQRDMMDAILRDLGIQLGVDEAAAWQRRNDAAHGVAMKAGEELEIIRDIKLLKVMFHRMLLRMIGGADTYFDYATPGFPVRKLAEPVPPKGAP